MALFRRNRGKEAASASGGEEARPLLGKAAYCRVCRGERQFTKAWIRMRPLKQCMCCGLAFEDASALYSQNQPACPRCKEFLEHPGFEYGICDGCGSKFELVEGAVPGLLPNYKQRTEMEARAKEAPTMAAPQRNPNRIKVPGKPNDDRPT